MSGVRGAYARGLARREAIIDAATELFGRIGYRNATILDIATHAEISRTGLLHHFATKEALLKAVLARRDSDHSEHFASTADPLSGLRNLVALARHNSGDPGLVSLFAVLSAEAGDPTHPAHDYFVERYEHARSRMREGLARASAAKLTVKDVDIDHMARVLVALMDGLQIQWLLAPGEIDMAEELRAELNKLLIVPLEEG